MNFQVKSLSINLIVLSIFHCAYSSQKSPTDFISPCNNINQLLQDTKGKKVLETQHIKEEKNKEILVNNKQAQKITLKEILAIDEYGKVQFDFNRLKVSHPQYSMGEMGNYLIGGAILGASAGCCIREKPFDADLIIGGAVGAAAGIIADIIIKEREKNLHTLTEGLNLHGVAAKNNIKGAIALLNHNYRILDTSLGVTPLMCAVAAGHLEMVKLLLRWMPTHYEPSKQIKYKGSNGVWYYKVYSSIDIQDDQGNTALDWAYKCDHPEIIKILLQYNAHANTMNRTN